MTEKIIDFSYHKNKKEVHQEDDDSIIFSDTVINEIHDMIEEEKDICIFDHEYSYLTVFLSEFLVALYLKTEGLEHPLQKIADEIITEMAKDIEEQDPSNDNGVSNDNTSIYDNDET